MKSILTCSKPKLIDSVILRQARFPIVLPLSGCTLLSTWRTTLVSFIAASLTVLCTRPLNVCISLFDHSVHLQLFQNWFSRCTSAVTPFSQFCLGAICVCVLCRNRTTRALLATCTQPAFVFVVKFLFHQMLVAETLCEEIEVEHFFLNRPHHGLKSQTISLTVVYGK